MTVAARYIGPAVLFAEDDISAVPYAAVDSAVKVVIARRQPEGFRLRAAESGSDQGESIDPLSVEICAAIALSAEGERTLRDATASFADRGIEDGPSQVTRIPAGEGSSSQVTIAVQEALRSWVKGLAERNCALVRALAAVRREHEVLQNAFAALEEVVLAGNLPEKPAFALAPTDKTLSWADHPAADCILQRIPVSSRAISSIELCFLVSDETSKGHFEIALQSLEDGIDFGNWRVPFERIPSGWIQLQLDQALMGQPHTLQISIQANVREGEAPGLLLAAPSPLDDAVYATTSGIKGEAPLAFRVWRALPGLRSKPAVHGIQTLGRTEQSSRRYLPASQLASAEPIGSLAGDPARPLVQYFADQGELQVHPDSKELVSAYLKGAIPPFASRISASVTTRHAEADVLDYAMLAVPGRSAIESALKKIEKANGPVEGFSGWNAVPPMEQAQISLTFHKPPRSSLDLVLVTRAHERDTSSRPQWRNFLNRGRTHGHTRYAWARFFDIEVELAQQ